MSKTNNNNISDLELKLAAINQSHLLRYWPELNETQRENFLDQIAKIRVEEVTHLFERAKTAKQDLEDIDARMKPIPESQFESEERCQPEVLNRYRTRGLQEIAQGHVGVLLMAGGQGTRLGVEYPKGMYSVELPSGKTLFQIQAERIRRLNSLAKQQNGQGGKIIWYIMTSGPTDKATEDFFKKHNYFDLDPNDIVMFKQGLLPCFDFDGKIMLEDKDTIALAPDGNGGIYRALDINGILDDMTKRGVKYIHAYSVDNILVKLGDPIFIGYCAEKEAECGAKVVRKAYPSEAVGVICQVDGLYQVVEYSEIAEATANLRDEKSNLVFSAGNICNHFFSTDFLRLVANKYESKLKLHVAKKKIKYINDDGEKIKPNSANGIKIEKFVFDVFQFSERFVTWEVPRHTEFSAMKNSDDVGKDCPSTARRDLLALHKRYIERAGGKVIGDEVEISPLLSYAGEDLESITSGKTFESPSVLWSAEELRGRENGY